MNVVALEDGDSLALAATALVEYLQARDRVVRDGLLVKRETKFGFNWVLNPAARMRSDAWIRYRNALKSFGMDPQSRDTVSTVTEDEKKPTGIDFFN